MELLKPYLIPISGLKNGVHLFDFQIDGTFFRHFESSPIKQGNIRVDLELDKRFDMIVTVFTISGTIPTSCDRCTSAIDLPINGRYTLILKYDNDGEFEDQADLVYVSREATVIDVSKYIYEYITLSVPLIKVYDCDLDENPPCNPEILDRLNGDDNLPDKDPPTNPIWDALKELK